MNRDGLTRRRLLIGAGGITAGGIAAAAITTESGLFSEDGMALEKSYNVAGDLWIGPAGSRSGIEPSAGSVFVASDTQVYYFGDGGRWIEMGLGSAEGPAPSVYADSFNCNRVYDSTGRYHGELTGSKDAGVLTDAIEDRPEGANIIVPDPGFDLEWEQQVDLPAAEAGFGLYTEGCPRLTFPSGFSGDYAISKPATTAGTEDVWGYRLGGFVYDDSENQVLSRAIHWADVKESIIHPSLFYDTPGIVLSAPNKWTNQNLVLKPTARSERGPLVEMEAGNPSNDDPEADQNWVLAPHFNDKGNYTETAYVDQGRGNTWAWTRCETAERVHLCDGAWGYNILEGQWDRRHSYTRIVEEKGDRVHGTINAQDARAFSKSRIVSASTELVISDSSSWLTEPVEFESMTMASTLSRHGLRDDSDGGRVSIEQRGFSRPCLELATSGSGETAVLDCGDNSVFGPSSNPKLQVYTAVDSGSDVLVRVGFYGSADDHAELVYDPTDTLGAGAGSNWYFQLSTDGTVRGRSASGTSPDGDGRELVIQREKGDRGSDEAVWSAHVGNRMVGAFSNAGTPVDRFQFRVYLESLGGGDKEVRLEGGGRRLRMLT